MPALHLIAQLRANPDNERALEDALRDLVEPTRGEEGCLQYDLHAVSSEPGLFLLCERWRSRALWENHMAAPHLEAFKARADALVAEWKLLELEPVA